MFAVGASTVSTNIEHYDFSLNVIQVLLQGLWSRGGGAGGHVPPNIFKIIKI